jgi:hypothetical protein
MAVAVVDGVPQTAVWGGDQRPASLGDLAGFRQEWYDCLILRSDALFELTDAVLCADGPVTSMVGLSLTAQHPSTCWPAAPATGRRRSRKRGYDPAGTEPYVPVSTGLGPAPS